MLTRRLPATAFLVYDAHYPMNNKAYDVMTKCTRIPVLSLFALMFLIQSATAVAATALDKALAQFQANPPVCADAFDFIVIGDNQNYVPTDQPECFKQMLREFNVLEPSFVMDVGDLILGGSADSLPPQWDAFERITGVLKVPFLAAPGNHDISDAASEKLWEQRMGPTRYTVRYGNSLFIVLDSEEVGALERIPDAQVDWLKAQLQAAGDAKNIFLFLHQPLWSDTDELGRPKDYTPHWDNVEAAIQGYPVRACFSGHVHCYRDGGVRGGVHYAITGGAGVGSGGATEEEGDFNHYLLVRVRGDKVNWSVIRQGNVLPPDVVTGKRMAEMYAVRHELVSCEEVDVPYGAALDRDVIVTIKNPHAQPFDGKLSWQPVPGWTVTPEEAAYTAPANGSVPVSFRIAAKDPAVVRYPVPRYNTVYGIAEYGPPVTVSQDLPLTPTMDVKRVPANIQIDADLSEWAGAVWAPVPYPSEGFDAAKTDDLSCRMSLLWDDQNLYFATETTDNEHAQPYMGDTVWAADNIEFFIDAWHWGFTLTKQGPETFLYEGVGESAETVNTEVRLAVKRVGTTTRYEAAIPARLMRPAVMQSGTECRVCMIMNDLDNTGERHWLELMPGAGLDNARVRKIRVTLK